MKKNLFLQLACLLLLAVGMSTQAKAQVLSDFYEYEICGNTYNVIGLTDDFKTQLNKAEGGSFTDTGGYTWTTGMPLPNPAPDGMYEGEEVIGMSSLFYGCSGLTTLDLSNFNTVNVTEMREMFWGCPSMTTLDLSNFSTANVTDMREMFWGCSSLTTLNLSNFNTSNVENMSEMFSGCSSLTELNLSGFNTSNVTDMSEMFIGCSALTTLSLSNFNTANVTDMSDMFSFCSSLTTLNLSTFVLNTGINLDSMFINCGQASNGIPAQGIAKDAATAAMFNDEDITGINANDLLFEVGMSIDEFTENGSQDKAIGIYTISGQRVEKVDKAGIYIINGKKVVVTNPK